MINYVNGLLAYTKNIDKNYYLKIKDVRARRFQPHLSPAEIAKNKFN